MLVGDMVLNYMIVYDLFLGISMVVGDMLVRVRHSSGFSPRMLVMVLTTRVTQRLVFGRADQPSNPSVRYLATSYWLLDTRTDQSRAGERMLISRNVLQVFNIQWPLQWCKL